MAKLFESRNFEMAVVTNNGNGIVARTNVAVRDGHMVTACDINPVGIGCQHISPKTNTINFNAITVSKKHGPKRRCSHQNVFNRNIFTTTENKHLVRPVFWDNWSIANATIQYFAVVIFLACVLRTTPLYFFCFAQVEECITVPIDVSIS